MALCGSCLEQRDSSIFVDTVRAEPLFEGDTELESSFSVALLSCLLQPQYACIFVPGIAVLQGQVKLRLGITFTRSPLQRL